MAKDELRLYLYGIRWEEAMMPLMDSPTCKLSPSQAHLTLSSADLALSAPGEALRRHEGENTLPECSRRGEVRPEPKVAEISLSHGFGVDTANLLTTDRPEFYKGRQRLNSARLSIQISEAFTKETEEVCVSPSPETNSVSRATHNKGRRGYG